ncbi:hypothetical protein NQ317_008143 [Molorchus minor]|uniref:Exoribonuclease phosphorolytic domain-containing protein n=1 Tax=Molorchus minor TaxID=1323400 RepID=A0ABQ9JJA1_9CUCU|nr:hypothetical protein NQ317_008143 [Molorchus minor]
MPVDHKRINGPEETVPYSLFTKLNTKSLQQQFKEQVRDEKRSDNRLLLEHRKIFIKTGLVSQAKGSAYIEQGKTKVIVSVFDPREIPNRTDYSLKGEIYCEFKFATFSCTKRRLHQQDTEEKQYSALMKQALDSTVCRHEFPNFQVDIYAFVLHNDGSALSAAITAAGVALAHAGVPMYDLIVSATLGIQQNIKLLDPSVTEQWLCEMPVPLDGKVGNQGVIVMSMLQSHEQISQFYQVGNLSLEDITDSIKILENACKELIPLIQKHLVKHVLKTMKNKSEDK